MKLKRRRVAALAIVAAIVCVSVCTIVIWRVERGMDSSRREAGQGELLSFQAFTLGAQPNPGFEGLSVPAIYKSMAVFEGHIYLAGPAGLYAYAADGTLEHIYRTGIDLPAAPLGQMAVGMLTDAKRPELLISTLGAGIVCFDGHLFRQILGTNENARVITSLLPLASGRLLIGTAKLGLLIYDGKTLRRFHPTTNNVYVPPWQAQRPNCGWAR